MFTRAAVQEGNSGVWERPFGLHTNSLALEGLGTGPGHGWPLLGQGPAETGHTGEEEDQTQPNGCLCVMEMGKDGRIWPKDSPVQSSNIQVETG